MTHFIEDFCISDLQMDKGEQIQLTVREIPMARMEGELVTECSTRDRNAPVNIKTGDTILTQLDNHCYRIKVTSSLL